jgi:dTDP-4-amino-4,6-dideoxygalactose transaminase
MKVPFNKPYMTGEEINNITIAHKNGVLAGDGPFTKQCHQWLEKNTNSHKVLLTHSCTAALEMAAILLDIKPGDEIIMPSYTFVSTANAFVLQGGIPVFVDIRSDTLNIDESLIESAITSKTRAIVVVHYAGVACEMDVIMEIARRRGLPVVEDAAQGVMSTYKGRALGSIGDLGCYSFHETKNVICGEGGALLVNNPSYAERAEIIREKGTNRSLFFRGQVDKYTWVDRGSSYLPGELSAAFLFAQLQAAEGITNRRLDLWNHYHQSFEILESKDLVRRPIIPPGSTHNGHMYYLLLPNLDKRTKFIESLRKRDISAVFHYIPLHSAPAGIKLSQFHGDMRNTNELSDRLVRLPLWLGLESHIDEVIQNVIKIINTNRALP